MKPKSVLAYGGFGVGKTALLTSSFWDYQAEKPVVLPDGREAKGQLISIGREDASGLALPDDMVKTFPVPAVNPHSFIEKLDAHMKRLIRRQKGDDALDYLVFDGFTELNYAFTWSNTEQEPPNDRWETYRLWQSQFIATMLMLDPRVLGCHVMGTARVAEKKTGTKSKQTGETMGADPEWMDNFNYFPAMEGWAKQMLGHYWNFVVYMDQGIAKTLKGKPARTTYQSHWQVTGAYAVKNTWEHKWDRTGLGPIVENMMWPEIEAAMTKAES